MAFCVVNACFVGAWRVCLFGGACDEGLVFGVDIHIDFDKVSHL